jgi:hypothetical protein
LLIAAFCIGCSFGWEYRNPCSVDLDTILAELPKSREPVFYDAYLRTGLDTLFPVPVKVSNYDESEGNSVDTGTKQQSCKLIACFLPVFPAVLSSFAKAYSY